MKSTYAPLLWYATIHLLLIGSYSFESSGDASQLNQSPWGWAEQWQLEQQTPWDWEEPQQHRRELLQNPMKPTVERNGRRGRMEDFVPPGYPLELHHVWTHDGWALGVYRIPHGKQRNSQPGKRPVVLLLHGFSLSSLSFALFNPNESIAYVLADAGFDVWMLNNRGNDFSRGNLHYSHTEAEYWYISADEQALIDLPTTINYVLDKTGAKKLSLLTHSQGGALAYMMLSTMPEMQSKVSVLLAMGPPAFLEYMRAPFLKAWATIRNDRAFFSPYAYLGQFLTSSRLWPFLRQCDRYSTNIFCAGAIWQAFYGPSDRVAMDDWVIIFNTWPATVASRVISHWAQMMTDTEQRLQRYDFGTNCGTLTRYNETCNQQKYSALQPPEYDLSKIAIPVFILQGSSDIMVTEEDIAEQQRRIPGAMRINYERYSHMDFVWDRNARHALDVVDIFFRYAPGTF